MDTKFPKKKTVNPTHVKVWDVWVRISHWLIAILFVACFVTAKNHAFEIHARLASLLMIIVIFRILWGIFGSNNTRWQRYIFAPTALMQQIRDLRFRKPVSAGSHTPLGGLMAVLLIVMILAQGVSALFLSDPDFIFTGRFVDSINHSTAENFEDVHEIIGHVVLFASIFHILAAIFYWIWKRSNLIGTMITGRTKNPTKPLPVLKSWIIAVPCFLTAFAFVSWLYKLGTW